MTNKYIKAKMISTKTGIGGAFYVKLDFKLDNIEAPFNNIIAKIDTGCSISVIPIKKLNITCNISTILKKNDIDAGIKYYLSYGVETGGTKHVEPATVEEKIACSAMKFRHNVSEFKINDISINTSEIYVNYDRSSNILIGMDILKDWDIHMGTVDSGETIFLACPQDQLNDEYFKELNRLFHIGTEIRKAENYG